VDYAVCFTLVRVLQLFSGKALRCRITLYAASSAALLIYLGALAVFDSERNHPEANITSFGTPRGGQSPP
jgi:voltage-gated potassium channel